jgi:flagellar basal-body rod modification protein FlgD
MEVQSTQSAIRNAGDVLNNAHGSRKPGEPLGKDDFLKLLMTQMTNQDPLDPLDSKGMMDQFAQMGSLEQLQNIRGELESLNKSQASILQSTAAAYLDKDVTVKGGTGMVAEGKASPFQFKLPRAAAVQVAILDAGGSPVRTLDLGDRGPGSHRVEWDGRDSDGDVAPNGRYTYQIDAKSDDGESVPADTFVTGRISGVRYENGTQYLRMNGEEFTLEDVNALSNESERLLGGRKPMGPRTELTPLPPAAEAKFRP